MHVSQADQQKRSSGNQSRRSITRIRACSRQSADCSAAAGTTGGAVVFQATSREMIDVYSRMPYPRGTVIGADIFDTGIMLSDTDFVQFERYLNVSGLDMAIVGHRWASNPSKALNELDSL